MIVKKFYYKRTAGLLALVGVIIFVLYGEAQNSGGTNGFDRQAMLNNIAFNIFLPLHEDFVGKAETLNQAVGAFAQNLNPNTLKTAQEAWKEAALQWQRCNLFEVGSMSAMLFHNQISKTPANIELIEEHITKADKIDEAFIESIGSTSKGLPAIEYFLFSLEGNEAVISSLKDGPPERLQYLVALAQNLSSKAKRLYDLWIPEGDNFIEKLTTPKLGTQEPINILVNAMVAQALGIGREKIGRPFGKITGEPLLETTQGRLSGTSIEQIISNLEVLQLTFNGADGLGFDDYLDFIDTSDSLAEKVNQKLDGTLDALKKIGDPLDIAVLENPEQVEQAYAEVRELAILLRADTANQLGVTITFNDSDGD